MKLICGFILFAFVLSCCAITDNDNSKRKWIETGQSRISDVDSDTPGNKRHKVRVRTSSKDSIMSGINDRQMKVLREFSRNPKTYDNPALFGDKPKSEIATSSDRKWRLDNQNGLLPPTKDGKFPARYNHQIQRNGPRKPGESTSAGQITIDQRVASKTAARKYMSESINSGKGLAVFKIPSSKSSSPTRPQASTSKASNSWSSKSHAPNSKNNKGRNKG